MTDSDTLPRQHLAPRPTATRTCRVTDWRPHDRGGALLGKCTVQLGGMQVSDVPIFIAADGVLSVGTPSMPLVGADGVQLRDPDGKRRYSQVIKFLTAGAKATWSEAVLGALAAAGIGASPQQIRGGGEP
jgi:hypothetical protein